MIWIILSIGAVLRIISLNQSLWLDEGINVLATKNYSFLGMITEYARADFHPPGYFIISWMWNRLFGIDEIIVRIPSVIFGIVTIYIIYLIGKRLHSKTLGLISALLLAINPLHIYYSQEARMYALTALAVSLNIFIIIKLLRGEKLNLFLLMLSNLAVLSSDYGAYFIFIAQLILLLINRKQEIFKKWLAALTGAIVLGIWWLPVFLDQLNVGSIASAKLPTWKFVVGSFDIKAAPLTFVKFIIGRISYSDKSLYAIMLVPIIVLFGLLVWKGAKFINKFGRDLLLFWFLLPIVLTIIISIKLSVYSYFRELFTLPAFVILVALGILSFKKKLRIFFLIAVLAIEIFSAAVYLLDPQYQREDWRGLVQFLKLQKNPLVLFESSGTFPPFDYYAKDSLNAKGALKDFPINDENGLIDLEKITETSKDLYLVNYIVAITDPNRLVKKRLTELGYKNIDTRDFHGVGFLYHYAK